MTTHSMQPSATTQAPRRDLRAALAPGLLTIIAGAVQGDGAIITAVYRDASRISDEQLSYPWDGATAIATSADLGYHPGADRGRPHCLRAQRRGAHHGRPRRRAARRGGRRALCHGPRAVAGRL